LFLCAFIAEWCCYCFCVFLQVSVHVVDFVHFYNQMLLLILCVFYKQMLLLLNLYAFATKCCWCCTLLELTVIIVDLVHIYIIVAVDLVCFCRYNVSAIVLCTFVPNVVIIILFVFATSYYYWCPLHLCN
jgi:hypothetical protein